MDNETPKGADQKVTKAILAEQRPPIYFSSIDKVSSLTDFAWSSVLTQTGMSKILRHCPVVKELTLELASANVESKMA